MHRNFLIPLLCYFVGVGSIYATTFEAANQQFQADDFAGAAKSYEKILTESGPNSATYYNLGNSYQSLKQYGPAILAYERARLLTPRDTDLLANLALARKAAGSYEETARSPWLDSLLTFLSRRECSWLVVAAASCIGLLSLVHGLARLPKRWLISISLVAGFIFLGAASILYLRRNEAHHGITLPDNASLLISPFEKAESVGSLSPGRTVLLGQHQGEYCYVEVLGTSLHGWLSSRDFAPLIQDPAH